MSHSWQSFPSDGVLRSHVAGLGADSETTHVFWGVNNRECHASVMHIVMNPGKWRLRTEKKGKSDSADFIRTCLLSSICLGSGKL